jgi:hypothetical protein
MFFSCLFCLLSRGSANTVLNFDQVYITFGCVSLGFTARGYGLAAPSIRLLWVALLALMAELIWYVCVGFRLGRECWVGATMIASGLRYSRRCCALRLEGKSQAGITPICVSLEGRVMLCCTIVAHLPTFHCAC